MDFKGSVCVLMGTWCQSYSTSHAARSRGHRKCTLGVMQKDLGKTLLTAKEELSQVI